jgi:hypothetical protein
MESPVEDVEMSDVSQLPPAPSMDVYSRLAGQYTASAQSKRQKAVNQGAVRRTTREKSNDETTRSPRERSSSSRINTFEGDESMTSGMEVDIDPLTGAERLVVKVHDDYREKISNRQQQQRSLMRS